jgi:hypothetical protein
MRFLFQACDDLIETPDIGGANAMDDGAFQCGQMTLDALRQLPSFCRQSDYECAAI